MRRPTPRQLQAAPPHFVGRTSELATLTMDLDGRAGGTVLISAIAGAGGIGKTALALYWAHRNLGRFPDGQLFVDLQGFSPTGKPVDPAVAVRGFLAALGVEPGHLPADLPAQAALYRSLVAGRRMLIVLDNAADATQVLPLLPGSDSCTVLVTSRRSLTSLVTRHGAHHLPIGILSDTEARELLVTRIGASRAATDPDAVAQLIGHCGGFALALEIVAGRAALNRTMTLSDLAAELSEANALDDDDPAVSLPAVLSWSVHALTEEQARAFALLGIAPGHDVSLAAAANLMGIPSTRARTVLRVLAQSSLLTVDPHGRYSMHDLIRAYATGTADYLPEDVREQALRRVVDFYQHTAYAADRLQYPHRPSIQLPAPLQDTRPHPLPDQAGALAWFDAEHGNLLAAQRLAADHHWPSVVWQLAWTLVIFQYNQGYSDSRIAAWRLASSCASQLPDPATQIAIQRNLGRAYVETGEYEEAFKHLYEALALAERENDLPAQAYVHGNLAWAWVNQGDHRKGLAHGLRDRDLRRAIGDSLGEANALNAMGWSAARLGDFDEAREYSEAALPLHRRCEHPHGEAVVQTILGFADLRTGHPRRALDHYERAIDLYRAEDNTWEITAIGDQLGECYAALGDHDRARTEWRTALAVYQRLNRSDRAERVRRLLEDLDEQSAGQA